MKTQPAALAIQVCMAVVLGGCGSSGGGQALDAVESHETAEVAAPCTAGERKCDSDGKSVLKCVLDGQWQVLEECSGSLTCDNEEKLCGCAKCSLPVNGVCTRVGHAECPSWAEDDGDCGCRPKAQVGSCKEHEIHDLATGNCVAVGPITFVYCVKDENGICRPRIDFDECGETRLPLPGGGCDADVGITRDCGTAPWGNMADVDAATAIYVFKGYTGKDTDGTKHKPFTTVADALKNAHDGTTIVVGAADEGTDYAGFEITTHNLTITGRCPALTRITVPIKKDMGEAIGTVKIYGTALDGLMVKNLSVQGDGIGMYFANSTSITIENVLVSRNQLYGISFQDCSAPVAVFRSEIRETRIVDVVQEIAGSGTWRFETGYGINARNTSLTISRTILERNAAAQIQVVNPDSLELYGCILKNGVVASVRSLDSPTEYTFAMGVYAWKTNPISQGTATIRNSFFVNHLGSAIDLESFGTSRVDSCIIKDTRRRNYVDPTTFSEDATGIFLVGKSSLQNIYLFNNDCYGIYADTAEDFQLTNFYIEHMNSCRTEYDNTIAAVYNESIGISLRGSAGTIHNGYVEGGTGTAISASDTRGKNLTLSNIHISGLTPGKYSEEGTYSDYGYGIGIFPPVENAGRVGSIALDSVEVENSAVYSAVYCGSVHKFEMKDSLIQTTRPIQSYEVGIFREMGEGVYLTDLDEASILRTTVRNATTLAINITDVTKVSIGDSIISGTRPGNSKVESESGAVGMGLGTVRSGSLYLSNCLIEDSIASAAQISDCPDYSIKDCIFSRTSEMEYTINDFSIWTMGYGLSMGNSQGRVENCTISDSTDLGILDLNHSNVSLKNSTVTSTRACSGGMRGHGLKTEESSVANIERGYFAQNSAVGIIFLTSQGSIRDSVVTRVNSGLGEYVKGTEVTDVVDLSDGVEVGYSAVDIDNLLVSYVKRIGIFFYESSGTLKNSNVQNNQFGLYLFNSGDVVFDEASTSFRENESNLAPTDAGHPFLIANKSTETPH